MFIDLSVMPKTTDSSVSIYSGNLSLDRYIEPYFTSLSYADVSILSYSPVVEGLMIFWVAKKAGLILGLGVIDGLKDIN